MSTPGGVPPPASTGGAAQTKSQAGVTGNACCLVGEGGEGGQPYCKEHCSVYAVLLAVCTHIYGVMILQIHIMKAATLSSKELVYTQ